MTKLSFDDEQPISCLKIKSTSHHNHKKDLLLQMIQDFLKVQCDLG